MKDEIKTTTIKEALSYPEGTPVQRMTGKLTHIFARKEGAGDFGPYTSQSGVIEDGQDKILFTVWNRPNIPEDYKGRLLIFRTGGGKKPSMTLKSDFKDATKRTLNVTKTCMVVTEEEDTDDIPYDQPETPKPQQNAPKASTAPKSAIQEGGVKEVKMKVMQITNLRHICDMAAASIYPGAETSFVKEIATSIFIQATRDGLHHKLPDNKPISSKVEATDDLHEEEQVF